MNDGQVKALKGLAARRKYGHGKAHAYQVDKLGLQLYSGLVKMGMLAESGLTRQIIEISALLHDVALPQEPHNEVGFDLVRDFLGELPGEPLPAEEASAILYCILWHRDDVFTERGDVEITDRRYVEKVGSIIRVADALDRGLRQVVDAVSIQLSGTRVTFLVRSREDAVTEISRARIKSDLMKAAYGLTDIDFKPDIPTRKKILLVCGGNTCRSPMAKVILEQKLHLTGKTGDFDVDSAACDHPTLKEASVDARKAIMEMYGHNLLNGHMAKKLTPQLAAQADLILVMEGRMKIGLPRGKTWTLKEYGGGNGDIIDPFGGDADAYSRCASEIATAIDRIIPKLIS